MTLKEQINSDFMEAYKAKDMTKKNFLGVLKGMLQTEEGKNVESTDENVLKVVKKMEKGLKETIILKTNNGQPTNDEENELSYLVPYLPQLMSEQEIEAIISDYYNNKGLSSVGDMMKEFNSSYKGKADNRIVSSIINRTIAGR